MALRFASEELRGHVLIALDAIRQNPLALQYVAEDLRVLLNPIAPQELG
jgi:hypothetical protein